ncbi:hypothetical protein RHSIM_Rhsim11G0179900 [Rhododendron simsii]|uniref:15-cis-phytoene synthase n=1 Tax=Rhododendron simsii TaxID=118357 RepID=A0A834G7E8_RHOSS|nr:hypothetical protein RHSIM_Rhsim11G0179900 [Rhododendron simsii]
MAFPICMGVVPLSFQGYCLGGMNGCTPLSQGKRKLELGEAQIKTRQPMKQNSESVYQPRRFNLSCKSVQTTTTPAAVAGFRILDGTENPTTSIKERVEKLVSNQRTLLADVELKKQRPLDLTLLDQFHGNYIPKSDLLKVAYDHCREIFVKAEESLSFAWGKRLDELVDGINGSHATNDVVDRWKQSTFDAFQGRPWNIYDVALSDTVSKFPLEIQLFKDIIEGVRSDMTKKRFQNFDELYLYNYHNGSAFFLLLAQAMGISAESKASLENVYHGMITFGVGFSLMDQLRDVGPDARMGRIYLPQDELLAAGLSDDDVFRGKVTDKWRKFMKGQIERARVLLDEGSSLVIQEMNDDVGWGFWALAIIAKEILDVIEANDYETFTRETYVGKPKILLNLLLAYAKSLGLF